MASPVIHALEHASHTGSSEKLHYWAFRHPNPDAPPETYRLTRRAGNGWAQLLAASKQTKEVLAFFAETPEDVSAVREALRWLGIAGQVESSPDGNLLRLAAGQTIPSRQPGGEKPKAAK